MLVLARKVGERVMVGDKVVVTVVRIGPNSVRLGIEAPKDMNIVREELCDPNGIVIEGTGGGEVGSRSSTSKAKPKRPRLAN